MTERGTRVIQQYNQNIWAKAKVSTKIVTFLYSWLNHENVALVNGGARMCEIFWEWNYPNKFEMPSTQPSNWSFSDNDKPYKCAGRDMRPC